MQLEEAGVGWISALPWNQAPQELRERATEELPPCSTEQPGVRAVAQKLVVHGQEYLAVVKYSAPFAAEQLHSLTTSISRTLQSLRRFAKELNKPRARWTEEGIKRKIQRWLSGQFLSEVIRYQLESRDGQWRLQFDFDQVAFEHLLGRRFGRTVLLTNASRADGQRKSRVGLRSHRGCLGKSRFPAVGSDGGQHSPSAWPLSCS